MDYNCTHEDLPAFLPALFTTSPATQYSTNTTHTHIMKLSDMYLVLYNSACALGWALVLFLAVPTLLPTPTLSSLASFYSLPGTESIPALATVLFFVQSAAILEVLHPMLGLVRSPVLVTAMQVSSRLVAL